MITWEIFQQTVALCSPRGDMVPIQEDTDLFHDLGYDSVALMELLTELECRFGVDFTTLEDFDQRMEHCGDIWKGVCELVTNQK